MPVDIDEIFTRGGKELIDLLDHAVRAVRAAATVAPPLILPPKFLFDTIDLKLRRESSRLRAVSRRYRPNRSPLENLPGGRMNAGQKYFVEKVWEPNLRPRLVSAGFRRVGSIA